MIYLDTSAAVKLVVADDESGVLLDVLSSRGQPLVSSTLLAVELRRALHRLDLADDPRARARTTAILDGMALLPIDQQVLARASDLGGEHLRSLDAIHLATALTITPAPELITYDERLGDAAREVGLTVHTPTPAP